MASGVINGRGMSTGNITKDITAGTLEQYCCYRIDNVVTVGARIHSMSPEQQAYGTFFVLPAGFRPRTATRIMGAINIGGIFHSLPVSIDVNGNVIFPYSTGKTTDQVQFAGTFPV